MDSASQSAAEVAAQAAALAKHLQSSGVQFLPTADPQHVQNLREQFTVNQETSASEPPPPVSPPASLTPGKSASPAKSSSVPVATIPAVDSSQEVYPGQPLAIADRQPLLDEMAAQVAACTRCLVLSGCRTQTVFGEGSPNPRVVFFGEGPGADEDRTGRPFVGKAGHLLTKMIEACTFRREDVYILNTVKCRPPGNRNPEPDEIEQCREYFQRQLAILRPEYIVCLGAVSSQTLLQSKLSVGRLRGKLHCYFESKVLVTYHPAYLLRTPAAKKAAWEDLQLMLRDAGIDPKAAS
jgi:DNA polymerase